jgi:hypothetical protein
VLTARIRIGPVPASAVNQRRPIQSQPLVVIAATTNSIAVDRGDRILKAVHGIVQILANSFFGPVHYDNSDERAVLRTDNDMRDLSRIDHTRYRCRICIFLNHQRAERI